nr:hypothetical protein [Tanacetum cinerariifolium]
MNENDLVYENHATTSEQKNLEDPFGYYKILNRKNDKEESKGEDLVFPQGFTLDTVDENFMENNEDSIHQLNVNIHNSNEGISSVKSESSRVVKIKPGGSILEVMEDLIEVGQTIGYNMEGCMKHIKAIIGFQGDRQALGSYALKNCPIMGLRIANMAFQNVMDDV